MDGKLNSKKAHDWLCLSTTAGWLKGPNLTAAEPTLSLSGQYDGRNMWLKPVRTAVRTSSTPHLAAAQNLCAQILQIFSNKIWVNCSAVKCFTKTVAGSSVSLPEPAGENVCLTDGASLDTVQ